MIMRKHAMQDEAARKKSLAAISCLDSEAPDVSDEQVFSAIRYLDPDLEGIEQEQSEAPSDDEVFLAIRYLDPDLEA